MNSKLEYNRRKLLKEETKLCKYSVCGDCRHFREYYEGYCYHFLEMVDPNQKACECFRRIWK